MKKSATKPNIGAHVSIAGGIPNAPARAAELGCGTFQCFTRSPQGGPAPALTPELVSQFRSEMEKHGMETFYIHAPYYINLASLEPRIYHSSISVLRQELERGSVLNASFVMAHIGSHAGQTLEDGLTRSAEAIKKILDKYSGSTGFLIEISAGAGNVLGDTFDEIGELVRESKELPGFAGICFDTCHAFASGYDFRTAQGAKKVLAEFDKKIGLKWLKLSHVQDSKTDLGGKKDRHEHIGEGFIGQDGLKELLTTKPFLAIDWILETEDEGRDQDVKKLKEIRGF